MMTFSILSPNNRRALALLPPLMLFSLLASGCDCSGPSGESCDVDSDCSSAERCIDGMCQARPDASPDGGPLLTEAGPGLDGGTDAGLCAVDEALCGRNCCAGGELCRFGDCVSDLGACEGPDDCWGDSYCETGRCIPYGVPTGYDHDESCERSIDIESISPEVQCRWTGPPEGDTRMNEVHVMATPIVVDLNLDDDPSTLSPSIVFTSFPTVGAYHQPGVLRIIDGGDCSQQFTFNAPEDAVMSPASVAAGDLDGDGRAEIVAVGHTGGLKAFRFDSTDGSFSRIWTSGRCDDAGGRVADNTGGADEWPGPSLHDLDDDGVTEIIYGANVYDADGCMLTDSIGYPAYNNGVVPVLADVDQDGRVELVAGNRIDEFNPTTGDWEPEAYFTGVSLALGQVALADLGDFPLSSMGDADAVEVVVISRGMARVQTLEGTIVFGPVAIPGGGVGGPPTVADFDGDGRREFASAGGSQYAVFDLDCVAEGGTGVCGSGRTDGILWTAASQDGSSNVTGSSVFDFDANGAAEAVYADECFLRVYNGADGTVLYSAARSSGTTYENPVIADADGDFHSEIVSAVNDYGNIGCPATDPLFPSATYTRNHGIVVLRDPMDRWAASRPIWNQHAYAVTHVNADGTIPATSAVAANWLDPTLNNFRQNVQGALDALGQADLTAASEAGPLNVLCDADGAATLPAQICNRGTLPLAAGTEIAFRVGAIDGEELCRTPVPTALTVGMCAEVTCTGTLPADGTDLFVEVDPDGLESECWEGNNFATLRDVRCVTVD